MPEYIERKALLKEAESRIMWSLSIDSVYSAIQEAPAADVAPVVHCKDCEFYKPQSKVPRWNGTSLFCTRSVVIKFPPDGFCSYGKPKEAT